MFKLFLNSLSKFCSTDLANQIINTVTDPSIIIKVVINCAHINLLFKNCMLELVVTLRCSPSLYIY